MPDEKTDNSREDVLRTVDEINDAWTSGLFDRLEELFHDDMVIVKPGGGRLGVGKKACVDSYREFCRRAEVFDFEESNFSVDIWEDTAVVSYRFSMKYEIDGEEHSEKGFDIFVMGEEDGRWRALWRTVV